MMPLLRANRFHEALPFAFQVISIVKRCAPVHHYHYTGSLSILVTIFVGLNDFRHAYRPLNEVLQINPDTAQIFYDFANSLMASKRVDAAEWLLKKIFEDLCNLVRKNDPHIAKSLNQLGMLYYFTHKYRKAIDKFKRALKIWEISVGKDDLQYSDTCVNLALTYYELGFYVITDRFIEIALKIRGTKLGKRHPDYQAVLRLQYNLYNRTTDLAIEHHKKGEYDLAEKLYLGALEIRRKLLGKNNAKYVSSLNDLALLYSHSAKYEKAEKRYLEALKIIRNSVRNKRNRMYVDLIANLGTLYLRKGNYQKAKPLLEEVVKISRSTHHRYSMSLSNLSVLYSEMGELSSVKSLLEEALNPSNLSKVKEISDVHKIVNNFGDLYWKLGKYTLAKSLFKRAINICKSHDANNPDLGGYLGNLGVLYASNGEYLKAEPLLEQALKIKSKSLKKDHPMYANGLNSLGMVYYYKGDFSRAEPLLQEARQVVHTSLGENHMDYVMCLNSISLLYAATGRVREACDIMKEARAIEDKITELIFYISSDRERLEYVETLKRYFYIFLSFVLHFFSDSERELGEAMNLVLRRKGIVAEADMANKDIILKNDNPKLEAKLKQLTAIRNEIGNRILSGPNPDEELNAYNKSLSELTARREKLEIELGSVSGNKNETINWQSIANNLPKDTALIEFIKFIELDFQTTPAQWKSAHYLAFVLGGWDHSIKLVNIGNSDKIDKSIGEFIELMTKVELRNIDNLAGSLPQQDIIDKASSIRKLIFNKTLLSVLKNYKKIYVSPDGELSKLPIEALPLTDSGRTYFIDIFQITYLSSGRDILRFRKKEVSKNQCVVVADPDYDFTPRQNKILRKKAQIYPDHLRISFKNLIKSFKSLPATEIEAKHIIAKLQTANLKAEPYFRSDAAESKLKKVFSPFIFHISTHGYFLPDPKNHNLNTKFKIEGPTIIQFWWLMDPLLRAGLALAGANTFIRDGRLPEKNEDGILTAQDVAGLNLSNTELVVLAACDTAKGQINSGEGVFGFRRSFVLAGAQSMVMSLWRIPVARTIILMNGFYKNLILGQGRSEALQNAKLDIKKDNSHPFVWAPFICQGNPSAIF